MYIALYCVYLLKTFIFCFSSQYEKNDANIVALADKDVRSTSLIRQA